MRNYNSEIEMDVDSVVFSVVQREYLVLVELGQMLDCDWRVNIQLQCVWYS